MIVLHNEFKPQISPGEPIGPPPENSPAANQSLTPAEKKEDQFEKASADPEALGPYHLNIYARTFLGAMLLLSLIAFYIIHISGHGSLGAYGQTPYQPDIHRLSNH